MRILQFGRYDFDEEKGGVQFYADSLTKEIRKKIEVDLLVSAMKGPTRVEKSPRGWKVATWSLGVLASVPLSPTMPYWARKLCRERSYDLIHLNFPDPLAMMTGFFLPRKIPLVVTWHSDVIRQKWALPLYLLVLKIFMKRVARVTVATPFHLQSCPQLQAQKIDDKIEVIPFGIDPDLWKTTPENIEKAKVIRQQHQGKFLIFSFGRHIYYKGFAYLLEAMKNLENVHLILGGEGPLTEEFQAYVKNNGLESMVTLPGRLSLSDLRSHFQASDLFAFPSVNTTEAFGYAQLEAMMCGMPVLSTQLGNGVNYVNLNQKTGLVVPVMDSKALARAISTLQENPALRDQYAKAASERAFQEFTVTVMGERTMTFYAKVIQSHLKNG